MGFSVKKLTINYDMIQYETIWNDMKSKKDSVIVVLLQVSFISAPDWRHIPLWSAAVQFDDSDIELVMLFFDVCQTMWNNKSQQSNLWEFDGLPTITKVFILPRTNIKTVQNINWIRHTFKMSYCIYLYVILHIDTQNWKNTCKYDCILILKLQPPNNSFI